MLLHDFLTNADERYRVEVLGIPHLDTTKVETHDSWIVANEGIGVGTSFVPFPP